MSYKESKVDSKLVEGPITEVCGNPKDYSGGGGVTHGGEDLPGGKKESGGVFETVTIYEGLDKPKV